MIEAFEYNFDGLPGPSHHYGGLALGNIPSTEHKFVVSHPKQAALESLEKMRLLNKLGVRQAFLPPQARPDFTALRSLGFSGSDREILNKVSRDQPKLLLVYSSASSMWAANAATVSPSADTRDHRVHITPANLISHKHRAIEAKQSASMLKLIFGEQRHFIHHPILPNDGELLDEGAANHMRLTTQHGGAGIEIFVYGIHYGRSEFPRPKTFPARQSYEASKTIALTHPLADDRIIFVQQNPEVIDQGCFHNDLIATSNQNVLLYHEKAFANIQSFERETEERIRINFPDQKQSFHLIKIRNEELAVPQALETFFFNSQIVTLPDQSMAFIAPMECFQGKVKDLIDRIITEGNPINEVHYIPLQQSMQNGGGPACLRLRVVLTEEEVATIYPGFFLNEIKLCLLEEWIQTHYRDELRIEDLGDYDFVRETREALDELTQILHLGAIYPFQE